MAGADNMTNMLLLNMFSAMIFIVLFAEFGSVLTASIEKSSPPCTSAVAVKSGDTCFDISKGFNMSLSSFDAINPNVVCDHLFVGQWLCVNAANVEKSSPLCTSVVGVKSRDTCFDISKGFNMSLSSFNAINPNVNCKDLFVGQWLCANNGTAI